MWLVNFPLAPLSYIHCFLLWIYDYWTYYHFQHIPNMFLAWSLQVSITLLHYLQWYKYFLTPFKFLWLLPNLLHMNVVSLNYWTLYSKRRAFTILKRQAHLNGTKLVLSNIQLQTIKVHLFWHDFGKAEHESGSPTAHYRYTCGKTHGYENLWV